MTNDRRSPLHLETGNKATDKARSRTNYWAKQTQVDANTTNASMYVRAIKVVQEFFAFHWSAFDLGFISPTKIERKGL